MALRDLKSSLSLTKVNGFLDLQSNHENETKILHEFLNSSNQRFVLTGNNMNCKQKDLNNFTAPAKSDRFAYVWYAASLPYLCSALTAFKLLRALRDKSDLTVDFVLTYVKSDHRSERNRNLIKAWEGEGGVTKAFSSLQVSILIFYQKAKVK